MASTELKIIPVRISSYVFFLKNNNIQIKSFIAKLPTMHLLTRLQEHEERT